jgi:hypothetical protein
MGGIHAIPAPTNMPAIPTKNGTKHNHKPINRHGYWVAVSSSVFANKLSLACRLATKPVLFTHSVTCSGVVCVGS